MPMVSARGLTREFGARTAVEDVTFDLEPGQLCALLGPNGAGKTTTVRMLLGLIGPSRGTATVAGVDVPNDQARLAALRGRVGLLTETPGFYDRLSALENLTLFGRLYGMEGATLAARIAEYLDRLGLAGRGDDLVATYSKGMKQRLALIRAIFHHPDVIFFDEPTSGLDPESARDVRALIRSLKQAGRTIIVCTHNLAEASELADVIAVIKRKLLAFGPPAALAHDGTGPRLRVVVAGDGAGAVRLLRGAGLVVESAADRAASPATGPSGDAAAVATSSGTGPSGAAALDVTVADLADTPAVVATLVNGGVPVLEVRPIRASLEEIYLKAVGADG